MTTGTESHIFGRIYQKISKLWLELATLVIAMSNCNSIVISYKNLTRKSGEKSNFIHLNTSPLLEFLLMYDESTILNMKNTWRTHLHLDNYSHVSLVLHSNWMIIVKRMCMKWLNCSYFFFLSQLFYRHSFFKWLKQQFLNSLSSSFKFINLLILNITIIVITSTPMKTSFNNLLLNVKMSWLVSSK